MTSAYMSEFVSFNVLDKDYVKEKYKGKKNYLLEDIQDVEESINDTFKDDSIKEEEIVPIINKDT